jgi:hypothetical protein
VEDGAVIAVCVEIGTPRTFASALDWPGWSRSGRDEAGALARLVDDAPRSQQVVARVGHTVPEIEVPAGVSPDVFEVVERIEGNATTDFGAPGMPARAESQEDTPRPQVEPRV